MFVYKRRMCGWHSTIRSQEYGKQVYACKLKLHLTQCSKCVMFPFQPVLLLFWLGVNTHATPTCCPDLSWSVLTCPVLICPVLSCPSCPWLRWPIWDSHTETCHHAGVLLKDRGRCLLHLSVSVCLCPPLNPALALLTLFSSPFLSLSRGTRRGSPPVHPP